MTNSLPKITSDFALLDVMKGRHKLAKMMPPGSNSLPENERIPVVIRGWISHRYGRDDGTSIEFGVDVSEVEMSAPMATKVKATIKDGKVKPTDTTPAPLRKGKQMKADRTEKGLRKNREAKR